ncbi:MAG: hypothetical protein LBO09_08220 [Candidatus Peribacteria bacterium]|jgi:hypothetical protein|nr:hypothetical protein [Candidatus Peribacteria bacterium]
MFNALNAMAHNIVAGKEIFDGMSAENANIFSKENVQTAAFLMVLHGFNAPGSVLRAGKPIQFSLKNSVKWGISK